MERIAQVLALKGSHTETVQPSTSVLVAVRHMHARRVGSVLVENAGALVGILTERDVLARVIVPARDPATMLVGEVMTSELFAIDPRVTVAEAMSLMTEARCRHLPVIDCGRLCGLVSAGDLATWLVHEQQLVIDNLHDYITH
jgi:CBS domain-containing protein